MSFTGENGFTLEHYRSILSSRRTATVLRNTMQMVAGSTLIASLLGIFFAWLIAYTDIRFKRLIQLGILLPFIIPSYVSSLAWVQFFGGGEEMERFFRGFSDAFRGLDLFSMKGIILVMGLTTYPLVYLFTVNSLRQIPKESEQAARVSGAGPFRTFLKVTVPMAMPGIVGGIFVAFLNCIDNFGIPAFLGSSGNITVLTTYIYQQITGFGTSAFSRGSVLSVILGIISLTGLVLQWWFLRRSRMLETTARDFSVRHHLGRGRGLIEAAAVIFFIMTGVMPLLSLIVSPLYKVAGRALTGNVTLENYRYILTSEETRVAIMNSLRFALVTSILCLIIGTVFAYRRVRRPDAVTVASESLITLPYALPGTVFALSMIFAWMKPIPGWNPGIYGTAKILYIAYFTRFLSLQMRSSVAALQQLDSSIEEASVISGGSTYVKWRRVLIPLILTSALGGTFLVFLMSLTELTVSSLLYSSKSKTIGVSILSFQQAGYMKYATAFSSLIVILILLGYIIWWILERTTGRRISHGNGSK